MIGPYYMTAATAKALLAQSKAHRAEKQEARAKAEAKEAIKKAMGGWSDSALSELAEIHFSLNKGQP